MNQSVTLAGHEVTRDLRAEIVALLANDPTLTQAEISRQSGVGETRLSQWRNMSYTGNNAKLEESLARWIDLYTRRKAEARVMPTPPAWVATPTGQRIIAGLGYAQLAADMCVVCGGAGLGKTTALERYRDTSPNAWIATMSKDTSTLVPALEEIALALGLQSAGSGAKTRRLIVNRLRGTMGLLMIDEAHNLGEEALDEIRTIHDQSKVGIALVGNDTVYTRMTGGKRAEYLDRLYSRIGKRVMQKRPVRDDIDGLIAAWGVQDEEAIRALRDIAGKPGALRGMNKVLRLATMFSQGGVVDTKAIKAAWKDLGGDV